MIAQLADVYQQRRAEILPRLHEFRSSDRPYLIVQSAALNVYTNCNTIEDIYRENILFFQRQLEVTSDWLPYLEPWMGTGVYANAFGCEYVWREGDSPAAHYKYHSIDEVERLPQPRVEDSPVMLKVLECIRYFREQTHDQLPIALTDTQSANDTATLVLDAVEVFSGCYEEPEIMHDFLGKINRLIIDFSRRQMEAIGEAPMARPGHIMVSDTSWPGISISDDNLAVVSAEVGRDFCLKYDQELADAFGGLAIHSCGTWSHLMPDVAKMKHIIEVDCAIHLDSDPNPNAPEAVRDAFAGSGIAVKVRGPQMLEDWKDILPCLVHPDLKLIIQLQMPETPEEAAKNYHTTAAWLDALYG